MTESKIALPRVKDLGITVAMRTRGPGGQKTHRVASSELRSDKKVKKKSRAKVIVDIYASDDLKLWKLRCGRLRSWIEDIAPPFGKGGDRFLANGLVDMFTSHVEEELIHIEKHKEDFLASLSHLKARYEEEAGDLGDMPFPTEEELREKFSVEIDYDVITDADEVKLAGNLTESQRKQYEEEVYNSHQRKIRGVVKHVATEIESRLSTVVSKMSEYKPREGNTKAEGVFRDSLIGNVRDIAGLLEHWNITQDPEVDSIRRRLMTDIAHVDPETLRSSPDLRNRVKRSAEDILSRVGQLGVSKD